ncbi:MAG: hypothetical protein Q4E57_07020 [Eubacteriales bacterium]|nr:hypothetical protein [Eubacteriales bacterium]
MKKKGIAILRSVMLATMAAVFLTACSGSNESQEYYSEERGNATEAANEDEASGEGIAPDGTALNRKEQTLSGTYGSGGDMGGADSGGAYAGVADDLYAKNEEVISMINDAYDTYLEKIVSDPVRLEEIEEKTGTMDTEDGAEEYTYYAMEYNGKTMRYYVNIIGEPDEGGKYPLYIALHGGGGGGPEINDEQWHDMFTYYCGSLENGIYVACRGIEDTWDTHFRPESYYFYDRLIENMAAFYYADPNRVYLLGFSAGGDGVYAITPRMADRFAAVNMSSGHPNGVSLLNAANLAFEIQAGIRDYYSADAKRSIRAAEFEKTLTDFNRKYGFGFEHRVLIHVPEGHNYDDCDMEWEAKDRKVLVHPEEFAERAVEENWLDSMLEAMGNDYLDDYDGAVAELSYAYEEGLDPAIEQLIEGEFGMETEYTDTNAVRYVSQFVRSPAPENIIWDLGTRADSRNVTSFYWLAADMSVNRGIILASYDYDTNTIFVEPDENVNGDFDILFNPRLMNVADPITIVTPEGSMTVEVKPSQETINEAIEMTGDKFLAYVDKISYSDVMEQVG